GTIKAADRGALPAPGQGPSGPPTGDLEEIIRRVQEALGKLTPGGLGGGKSAGGGLGGRTILFLVLAAVLAWFVWGTFYTVQPNEVGINLVLGRYTGKTAAGLNTNWPWPIGSVIKVPVSDQQITEVGYRSFDADIPEESQMLTGDKNIVDVHFRVKLADRSGEARGLCVQHPEPARDGESGGREHHAGSRWPQDHRRHPDDRPRIGRDGRAEAHPGCAQQLPRGRPRQAGPVAVGRRTEPGHFRLSRRHRRAAGPAARRQRSRNLRQQGRARGRGRRGAHHRGGQRVSRA